MLGISPGNRFVSSTLLCLLALSGVGVRLVQAADQAQRPNILFIYTDDHSYRTVGCYPEAYSWARTPTIDRLAQEGMRFEYAYIGTWCMPSGVSGAKYTPGSSAKDVFKVEAGFNISEHAF